VTVYTLDWKYEDHEFWRDGVPEGELEAQVRDLLVDGVETVTVHVTKPR
jgi:hypothetical protein